MRRYSSIRNGKKGGRKSYNYCDDKIAIPNTNFVILTENQYETLVKRYGKVLLEKALNILENWLKTNPKLTSEGKNNYAYFRNDGWVINSARADL